MNTNSTKVLMISRDSNALRSDSEVYARLLKYSTLFELYVVVVGKVTKSNFNNENNLKIYNSTSRFKLVALTKSLMIAFRVGQTIKGDNLFVSSQDPFEAGLVSLVISKLLRAKLQIQIHTDCFDPYFRKHSVRNFFHYVLARIIIPQADILRVVSSKIEADVLELCKGIKPPKIVVLPILHDIKRVEGGGVLKSKFGNFTKLVLVVARLEKEKNLSLALLAFQKMLRLYPGIGLIVVGDGREKDWLIKYTRHLGISESVVFMGWVDNASNLMIEADLLLVTSFYEGYGMTIVEALSNNCPVVSVPVGIAPDSGAVIAGYDAGEIALRGVELLRDGSKGELNPNLKMSEGEYLDKYKETFII